MSRPPCSGAPRSTRDNERVNDERKAAPEGGEATGGPDDQGVSHDGGTAPRRRKHRRVVRRGTERESVLGVSADERPTGWGEGLDGAPAAGSGHGSNDEQLRRDVPPHWG